MAISRRAVVTYQEQREHARRQWVVEAVPTRHNTRLLPLPNEIRGTLGEHDDRGVGVGAGDLRHR